MASIKDPIGRMYDFGRLPAGQDGVILVDICGGKGHAIQSVRSAYPELKGEYILQDQPADIEAGDRACGPDVKAQPYDLLMQEQPVKGTNVCSASITQANPRHLGAAAYLLNSVLHDRSDGECRLILRNQFPAMKGYNSRLLIVELVLPEFQSVAQRLTYDIELMRVARRERSFKEWHALLEGTGLRIQRIFDLNNPVRSVIEVVSEE